MGKRSSRIPLAVYMNSRRVGTWSVNSQQVHLFRYDEDWLAFPGARPISLSLPLIPSTEAHSGEVVKNFFDNLLPDTQSIRERLQTRYSTSSASAYALLSEIGRDCIGALQIVPEDLDMTQMEKGITGEEIDTHKIAEILRTVPLQRSSLNSLKDLRISLAGAQEKTAFTRYHEKWLIPTGTTPTTHIFKLPIGDIGIADLSDSLENEYLCSKIIKNFGLPIAKNELYNFEDQKALIVTRFDRRWDPSGTTLLRIPHEDFCQVTGTSSALKYESDRGPGMKTIMDSLSSATNSDYDRSLFLKALMLNWLLAAPDGHAKNYSIRIGTAGSFSLAPL